jgi:hypothetical protein
MRGSHSEPEIIPPDRAKAEAARERTDGWIWIDAGGTRRIYLRRIGPLGIILLALLIGVLAALVVVVLVGAFLIWIPVAVLLFVAAIVGGLLRRYLGR